MTKRLNAQRTVNEIQKILRDANLDRMIIAVSNGTLAVATIGIGGVNTSGKVVMHYMDGTQEETSLLNATSEYVQEMGRIDGYIAHYMSNGDIRMRIPAHGFADLITDKPFIIGNNPTRH